MSFAAADLPALMREWAEWAQRQVGVGYPDSTTLHRAIMGAGGSTPGSREPAGIRALDTHGALTRLIEVMASLTADEDTRRPVACVQGLYLLGAEEAARLAGCSRAQFYQLVKTGELLLVALLRRG